MDIAHRLPTLTVSCKSQLERMLPTSISSTLVAWATVYMQLRKSGTLKWGSLPTAIPYPTLLSRIASMESFNSPTAEHWPFQQATSKLLPMHLLLSNSEKRSTSKTISNFKESQFTPRLRPVHPSLSLGSRLHTASSTSKLSTWFFLTQLNSTLSTHPLPYSVSSERQSLPISKQV